MEHFTGCAMEHTYDCPDCLVPVKVSVSLTTTIDKARINAALIHVDENLHILEVKIVKVMTWLMPLLVSTLTIRLR
jgi:hypothetical protein